jgi:hypothetical protein
MMSALPVNFFIKQLSFFQQQKKLGKKLEKKICFSSVNFTNFVKICQTFDITKLKESNRGV